MKRTLKSTRILPVVEVPAKEEKELQIVENVKITYKGISQDAVNGIH